MAASEQRLEIVRGNGRREATIRRRVDPDDEDELFEIGTRWLLDEGWDPDLWGDFKVSVLTPARLVEVSLG
jgi:hypothetical protein